MAQLLSNLLEASEPGFTHSLEDLEKKLDHPKIDVRLISEIKNNVAIKIKELGLDLSQTTNEELFQTLLSLAELHDRHIYGSLVNKSSHVFEQQLIQHLERQKLMGAAWSIKPAVCRKILKTLSPLKTIKILGYRSLDSMLKRESCGLIFTVARLVESRSLQTKMSHEFNKLIPADFAEKKIEAHIISNKDRPELAKRLLTISKRPVSYSLETGSIIILQSVKPEWSGTALLSSIKILDAVKEIKLFGAFCKYNQVSPHAGIKIENYLEAPKLSQEKRQWKRFVHSINLGAEINYDEYPHITKGDITFFSAQDCLYKIEQSLNFWRYLGFVGHYDEGQIISFSLTDIAMSLVNKLDFEQRVSRSLQSELLNEIESRYCVYAEVQDKDIEILEGSIPQLDISV